MLRDAFSPHGGVEVDTQGDAFFAVFASANDAVAALTEANAALADGPIRVRAGVHSGAPVLGDQGYVGLDVHLAARSERPATAGRSSLVGGRRRAGYRGAGRRARRASASRTSKRRFGLLQVGSEQFPPLKTISNTNLPRPASSFVGRTAEVAALMARVLDGNRLVTLTGPGGSGKTRLAIEAAAELVGDFPAGVFWVELAPLRDRRLVTEAIARMLGAKEELATHIGERRMLLLLDNLEGLTDAGPDRPASVERATTSTCS